MPALRWEQPPRFRQPSAKTRTDSATRGTLDVRAFGATGDGKTLDTPAINKAIDAAAAAGGGIVRFPAGSYLCYSIHLKSHITLFLDPGATIVAADAPAAGAGGGYDPPEPNAWDKFQDFGHSHWHNSLIWGEDLENISIEGQGLIWGKGLSRGDRDLALAAGVGNKSISLKNCRNVTLRDISILHGGHFAILATGVDNLTIDNLKIDTNRDAIDIDCCRNVRISNCSVNSPWDDGICLKDSYGLGFARSTDHVTITNCYVTGGYEEGTMLDATYKRFAPDFKVPRNGRIKFGTESNGGFRNITISNCVIEDCRGIALESVDGAILEDVAITNITMRDIVDVPFFLRLGSRMRGPEGTPVGELRRVLISNVVVSNCASRQATLITGIPGHYHRRRQAEQYSGAASRRRHQGGRRHSAAGTGKRLSRTQPLRAHAGPRLLHPSCEANRNQGCRGQADAARHAARICPRGCERRRTHSRQAAANSRGPVRGAQERQRFQRHAEQAAAGYASGKRGAEDAVNRVGPADGHPSDPSR